MNVELTIKDRKQFFSKGKTNISASFLIIIFQFTFLINKLINKFIIVRQKAQSKSRMLLTCNLKKTKAVFWRVSLNHILKIYRIDLALQPLNHNEAPKIDLEFART